MRKSYKLTKLTIARGKVLPFALLLWSWEAQRFLELCILDYMVKSGFHRTREAFSRAINANPNSVDINHPEGFLLNWWSIFYEGFRSRFPEVPLLAAESSDKVIKTVENVVPNINGVNPPYDPSHTGANFSNAMSSSLRMLSTQLIRSSPVMTFGGPDLMDSNILDFFSSISSNSVVSNSSTPGDLASNSHFFEMSTMDGMLPSASNSSYPMQQISTSIQNDSHSINFCQHMQMEPNLNAPANALPPLPESSDAGNNRSLQQPSHQGWKLAGVASDPCPPVISRELVIALPAQMEEQMNLLRLQSPNKRGRKRKDSLGSLAVIGTDGISSYLSPAIEALISANNSLSSKKIAAAEKGRISFPQIGSLHASKRALLSCHFHSDGKFLATAGQERKVVIWDLQTNNIKIGEGHADVITDIRFRPNSTVFATSSFDKSVMLWDAAQPSSPFQTLAGHSEQVMSTDFHSTKMELLSSCDSKAEIRLWDVSTGSCEYILRGGSRQVRFQPRFGNLLASCTGKFINIVDLGTNKVVKQLQGHVCDVRSICWDFTGNYLASVSGDRARIWCVTSGKYLHEKLSVGNKFRACSFHPGYGLVLVIGSLELLHIWNPTNDVEKTWQYQAHAGAVSSLAAAPVTSLIASVGDDQMIKIWE